MGRLTPSSPVTPICGQTTSYAAQWSSTVWRSGVWIGYSRDRESIRAARLLRQSNGGSSILMSAGARPVAPVSTYHAWPSREGQLHEKVPRLGLEGDWPTRINAQGTPAILRSSCAALRASDQPCEVGRQHGLGFQAGVAVWSWCGGFAARPVGLPLEGVDLQSSAAAWLRTGALTAQPRSLTPCRSSLPIFPGTHNERPDLPPDLFLLLQGHLRRESVVECRFDFVDNP